MRQVWNQSKYYLLHFSVKSWIFSVAALVLSALFTVTYFKGIQTVTDAVVLHYGLYPAKQFPFLLMVHHLLPYLFIAYMSESYIEHAVKRNAYYTILRIKDAKHWLFAHIQALLIFHVMFFTAAHFIVGFCMEWAFNGYHFTLQTFEVHITNLDSASFKKLLLILGLMQMLGTFCLTLLQLLLHFYTNKTGVSYTIVVLLYVVNLVLDVPFGPGGHIKPGNFDLFNEASGTWVKFVAIQSGYCLVLLFLLYANMKRKKLDKLYG